MEDNLNVEFLYIQNQDLIKSIVWNFMRSCGKNPNHFDEYFSQAELFFMEAMNNFDDDLSKLSTWLSIQIRLRLMRRSITDTRRRRMDGEILRLFPYNSLNTSLIEILDEISIDGKNLILLYRSGEMDLEEIYKGKFSSNNRKRPMFRFLKQRGWTRKQIINSFRDIEKIFS